MATEELMESDAVWLRMEAGHRLAVAGQRLRESAWHDHRSGAQRLTTGQLNPGRTGEVNLILAFFEHDFLRLIDVDRGIAEDAHRFCRRFGIYPNDAIHLACALRARCDVLLAWDNRFLQVKHHPAIRLEAPQIIGQQRPPGGG